MNMVLGPAPCRGCWKHVYFNGRDWVEVREEPLRPLVHVCPTEVITDPWRRARIQNILHHRQRRAQLSGGQRQGS